MLTLKFNDLIPNTKAEAELKKKIQQYLRIMDNVDPDNLNFQTEFAEFYQINNSGWKSPAIMRPLFFNTFSAFNEICRNGYKLNYEMVITVLAKISGMPEKSFSSKILHTLDVNEPIIDSQLIRKIQNNTSEFKLKTGYSQSLYATNYTLLMAIDLHNCLKKYYDILKSEPSTISYINDFNKWCKTPNIDIVPSLISETKKIDFWMWLA